MSATTNPTVASEAAESAATSSPPPAVHATVEHRDASAEPPHKRQRSREERRADKTEKMNAQTWDKCMEWVARKNRV